MREEVDQGVTGHRPTRPKVYHNVEVLVEVLARCSEGLARGELEVPQLVLHSAVEFLGVLLALHVELDADRGILGTSVSRY